MKPERIVKPAFCVIGREGSTLEGPGFIQNLWAQANARFPEVASLACRDEQGIPLGFWGAMSDLDRRFQPWQENFTKGLYLAGVECPEDAQPPEGWAKWIIPGFEYLRVPAEASAFSRMLAYLDSQGLTLAGAVHDFTCPKTGENYLWFPIRRL